MSAVMYCVEYFVQLSGRNKKDRSEQGESCVDRFYEKKFSSRVFSAACASKRLQFRQAMFLSSK
jgi:hypothetical protein